VVAAASVVTGPAELMMAEGVGVGVTSVRPVPEEMHIAPLGYECAGLHAYVVAPASVPTDTAVVGA